MRGAGAADEAVDLTEGEKALLAILQAKEANAEHQAKAANEGLLMRGAFHPPPQTSDAQAKQRLSNAVAQEISPARERAEAANYGAPKDTFTGDILSWWDKVAAIEKAEMKPKAVTIDWPLSAYTPRKKIRAGWYVPEELLLHLNMDGISLVMAPQTSKAGNEYWYMQIFVGHGDERKLLCNYIYAVRALDGFIFKRSSFSEELLRCLNNVHDAISEKVAAGRDYKDENERGSLLYRILKGGTEAFKAQK